MIYKSVQIGKTKNITLIRLGNGDIKVAWVYNKEDGYVGLEFVNDVPGKIGREHNDKGTTDESKPQAMLIFTDIKSIEVVEEFLKKAKIKLKNM